MFLPLSEAPVEPLYQTAIVETVEIATPKPPEPEIKELTLEEKIQTNHYKCDETRQYIRRDNAQCLDKPMRNVSPVERVESVVNARTTNSSTPRQTTTTQAPSSSPAPSGYYRWGWCTYGAWSLTGWAGAWGDAREWDDNARREGYTVSGHPIVGSIFVDNNGSYGHVGVVLAVDGNNVVVRDMNYSGFGQWTTRTVPSARFVYIYPRGV